MHAHIHAGKEHTQVEIQAESTGLGTTIHLESCVVERKELAVRSKSDSPGQALCECIWQCSVDEGHRIRDALLCHILGSAIQALLALLRFLVDRLVDDRCSTGQCHT